MMKTFAAAILVAVLAQPGASGQGPEGDPTALHASGARRHVADGREQRRSKRGQRLDAETSDTDAFLCRGG